MARRERGKALRYPPLATCFFLPSSKRGGRTPTDADPTAALAHGARSAERARLSAFHRGSHLRELFHPKGSASGQASWDLVWTGVTRLRLSQSREHLPSRSSCREADTQAARERTANPPASTAPAPPNPTSPHLAPPHLTSPHLPSPHLTSPHLTSPHLTSPHLTSPHLTSRLASGRR